MKKIGQLANLEIMENAIRQEETDFAILSKNALPEITPPDETKVALMVGEVIKAYLESGFPAPEEEIIFERAQLIAEELPEVPSAWLPRVFTVARREYAANPQVFHLLKAWREFVKQERHERIASLRPRVEPPPTMTPKEKTAAWRSAWLEAAARGGYCPKNFIEEHKITEKEIQKKRKELGF